jgi:hypothetical protein
MKERIYILGPISGIKDNNRKEFYDIADKLRNDGFEVTNPLDFDTPQNEGLSYNQRLRLDVRALTYCDSIYMLPDWKKSKGATLEHMVATMIGLKVIDYGS